ncbi:MAG: hypothetical protein IH602_14715 [Bryobacteraceae bacterium]|nr:hypothetical protein [Bryobacteraceae bacterium]
MGVIYLTVINEIEKDALQSLGTYIHPDTVRLDLERRLSGSFVQAVEKNFVTTCRLDASGYSVRMVPVPGGQARFSLFTDQTGVVRHTRDGSPAGKNSLEFR